MIRFRLFVPLLLLVTPVFAHDVQVARSASIGDGIAAFFPTEYDAAQNPSFALVSEPSERGPLAPPWKIRPIFSQEAKRFTARVSLPAGTNFYGTGEVTGPLLRNRQSITLWNTDNFAYSKEKGRRLYQTHPWVMGLRPDGSAFGVLFDTTWRAELKCTDNSIELQNDGPAFRVIVLIGPLPSSSWAAWPT